MFSSAPLPIAIYRHRGEEDVANFPRDHLSQHLYRRTPKLKLPDSGMSRTGPAAWRRDRLRVLQLRQGAQQAHTCAREHGTQHDGAVKDPPHEYERSAFRVLSRKMETTLGGDSSWSRPRLGRARPGHLHVGTMDSGYGKRGKVVGKGRNGKIDGRGGRGKTGGSVIGMIGRRGVNVISLRGKRDEIDKRGRRGERGKSVGKGVRGRMD